MIPNTDPTNAASSPEPSPEVLAWLQAACDPETGIAFMPLCAGEKWPIWRKETFQHKMAGIQASSDSTPKKINAVRGWLSNGWNVGICLLWSNLWVLDIDGYEDLPAGVQELLVREDVPQVSTPSGGRHLYLALPPTLVNIKELKAHVLHPVLDGVKLPLDVKLGGGYTYTVAPGSHIKKGPYLPTASWSTPPVVDPRDVIPGIQLFKGTPGKPGAKRRWDKDKRPLRDRIQAAIQYLKKAPVSVAGNRGRACLAQVVVHLQNFLQLDSKLAIKLMTTPPGLSWNARCLDGKTDQPYPWSRAELESAMGSCKGLAPYAGIEVRKQRIKNQRRDGQLEQAMGVLKPLVTPGGSAVPVANLHEDVCRVLKIPASQCTATRFGRLLRKFGIMTIISGRLKVRCVRLSVASRHEFRNHLLARSQEATGRPSPGNVSKEQL